METGDDGYWDGVALNLHGFYSGLERIFEDIARTHDRTIPSGSEWHSDLLVQMAAEIPDLRPAVISRNTRDRMEEYKGFRHIVRNVYAFNFRLARLKDLVDGLKPCFLSVQGDLMTFADLLEMMVK